MEARAPYSGGSVQAGGAAEPTTEVRILAHVFRSTDCFELELGARLQEVARLLADRKPWPAFLHAGLASDCPENVGEALAWMASGAVGLLNVASVGPLVPKLRELISWCVFLTEVLLQHGKEVDDLAPVMTPLNAFVSTTNKLAKRAKTLAARGKCTALLCFWRDRKQIQEFEEKLRNVWTDIQGVTMLTFHADFRRGLPPKTGEMAEVPQNARVPPPAFVERSDLVGAVVQDLVATDRATKKAHVLRGIPGGGKTVAASAVLRCEDVRRSFQDGIFWVQVGQVGTGNPLALLKGLAEDLAHAPSNRPHTVPHEFRDVDHVISHLEGVRKQGNLRCLIVLDDVWDPQMVPLFLRPGFHCLVTTRDLAVVPRHLRGTCTAVDVLTETEALKLLKKASRASSSIPRDEGVKVADDCGFLPLAVAIIGAMGSLRADPLSPETWRGVHARLVEEPTLVQDHVGGALAVSFRELNENARTRFRKLGVLVRGVRAPVDMVAHLWEQDPSDTILLLSDLVDKSLVKVVEQSYYLHDLVLDFAKDELRKSRGKVQLVTSRQAQYLGTISVLEDYARAGEVLRGFYALMALWQSVEDMSGDKQLEVSTYGVKLKALEGSEPMESVAYTNWAAGRLFELQGKFEEAEPLYKRSLAIDEKVYGPDHPEVATDLNNWAGLLESQGKLEDADPLYVRVLEILGATVGEEHPNYASALNNRAELLRAQGNYAEAVPLNERATKIWIKALGPEHPAVATALNNRALLLRAEATSGWSCP
ncbi:unnamed protein product [Scytosiphon promiscuus]